MENNKYYTPSIEEFHVGFEYEKYDKRIAVYANIGPTNWHKHEYHTRDIKISNLGMYLNEEVIRVKYLDREDIESLGFEDFLDNEFRLFKDCLEYCITIKEDLEVGLIDNCVKNNSYQILFKGIIKNKSELIKLLKQLNVK